MQDLMREFESSDELVNLCLLNLFKLLTHVLVLVKLDILPDCFKVILQFQLPYFLLGVISLIESFIMLIFNRLLFFVD